MDGILRRGWRVRECQRREEKGGGADINEVAYEEFAAHFSAGLSDQQVRKEEEEVPTRKGKAV